MIKAIIFDCFGVLCTDGWLPLRDKYFGSDPQLLEQATLLNKSVDAGHSTYREFIAGIAEMAHMSEKEARAQIENNVPDEALFHFIKTELKPNYKIGMLSNAGDNWLDEIFLPEQVALFDATSLSYATGVIKPDLRAYQEVADKLGVATHECVFIDDQIRYCDGARDAGMKAVYYTGLESLKNELSFALSND